MENHPIPQDITGFQFKLIGNMTIKQFAYLAGGTVLAWFCFFILPIFLIIRLPLALIFLGLGIGLAFVPIDGRPMDVMIINLIKAMFSPTQYIYRKSGGDLSQPQTVQTPPIAEIVPPPIQTTPLADFPIQPQITSPVQIPIDQPEKVIELNDPSVRPTMAGNLDDLVNIKEEEKLETQVSTLEKELEEAKALESTETNTANATAAHQKTAELEKILIETTRQKEALEKELLMLKARLDGKEQQEFDPSLAKPLPQTQRVKKIPPGMEKSVGLPTAPQDPNLITGIVKDPRGNPLPNILVEVKDTEDNPVRTFKTNGLGQFAAATSLSNGKYIISFEDSKEQNKFDAVEMEAVGAPILPLEIISVDPREELRRELFN